MKTQFIVGVCLAVCALSAAARADVCQKDDLKLRIRVEQQKDGSIAFFEGDRKVGPDTTFTREELEKKRWAADAIVNRVNIREGVNTAVGLFTLFAIAADPQTRLAMATGAPGPDLHDDVDARAQLPHAQVIADAFERYRVYPTKDCTYVDSVASYKVELATALNEVKNERLKKNATPADPQTLADNADAKHVETADSHRDVAHAKNGSPGPAQTPAQ